MSPIKIIETDPTQRSQNLINKTQKYDNCDVCGKPCNKKRYCCASVEVVDMKITHFDVCSLECADMGVLQRI